MTIPPFENVQDIALTTDSDLVDRLATLIDRAIRRQVWVTFLDAGTRQLPVVMPSYIPQHPETRYVTQLASLLRSLSEELAAAAVVLTYERPGDATLTEADRAWLLSLRESCVVAGVGFRGPFLCHDDGVRQVAPDDYLDG